MFSGNDDNIIDHRTSNQSASQRQTGGKRHVREEEKRHRSEASEKGQRRRVNTLCGPISHDHSSRSDHSGWKGRENRKEREREREEADTGTS